MRPAIFTALLVAGPLVAQQPVALSPVQPSFSADSGAIMQVVNDMFRGMRVRDTALVRAQFHAVPTMRSTANLRTGMVVIVDSVDGFLRAIMAQPDTVLLDERLGPPTVRVDGNFATVWAYYEFWRAGLFSHCGADLFSLARTGAGWKILNVSDSRRRAACVTRPPGLPLVAPFRSPPREIDSSLAVAAVLRLLDGMRTRDTAQMRRELEGSVPMRAAVQRPDGPDVGVDSGATWIAGVASSLGAPALDERIGPAAVEIDGNLASVSAYYEFRRGDQFSHCGMDQFVLGRTAGGWKVIAIGYSARRTGCPQRLTLDARQSALRDLVAAERAFVRYADSASAPPAFVWALREDAITLTGDGVKPMRPIYAARQRNSALLSWAPSFVDVAADGELGVTSGPWEWRPARDSAVQARGQFLTIWRKGPERWQVALDLGIGGDSTADLGEPVAVMPAGEAGRARLSDLTDLERHRIVGNGWVHALRALSAPGVRVLRENSARGSGPQAIDGAASVRFQSLGGTIATSGDLGATWGTWKDGAKKGSYVRIWKRTGDGWRVVIDRLGD